MIGGKKNTEMKDEDNKIMSMFGAMVLMFIWTLMLEKSFVYSRSAVCPLKARKSEEVLIMLYNSSRESCFKKSVNSLK